MRMLRSILFATDFGCASLEAAPVAVRLASIFGSRLTVFHAFHPTVTAPDLVEQERGLTAWEMREMASRLAAQQVALTEVSIREGRPAECIVHKALEIDADLILIGAGKWNRRPHFSPGPIAEAVLQHAEQPVLAIRPGKPALTFQSILCPVDHSPVSKQGLENAIALAQAFESRLTVLSVVPALHWLSAALETHRLTGTHAEHEQHWRDEFDHFLQGVEFGEVPYTREIRSGDPDQEILAAAEEDGADLIVMGSTGRTGLARVLMGSVTRRVLQQLPCSLLTVKGEDLIGQLFDEDLRHINLFMAEGREFLATGCYPQALGKFRQVLACAPLHVSALELLAEAHDKLGQPEQADRCRRRVEKLHCHLGR